MKKTFKFLVSTVTVVAVLATSVISALAATGSGTITVDNPQAGKTYSAYKIFNADVNGDSVKYTVVGNMTDDNNKALFNEATTPFEVKSGEVVVKDGKSVEQVISFVKTTIANNTSAFADLVTSVTASENGDPVEFTLPYGYYYINTGSGSAVTLTTVKGNATIIDKGDKPTWNPEDPSHPPTDSSLVGKLVSDTGEAGTYYKENTSGIKADQNTEYFMISAHCPKYAGSNVVKSYIFTDVLPAGLTYNGDAELYIDGSSTATTENFSVDTSAYTTDGTIVFTYTIPDDYEGAELVIKYTTTTNSSAAYVNTNQADMDWTYIPYDPDAPTTDPDGNPITPTPSNTKTDSTYPSDPDHPSTDPTKPATPPTQYTDTYIMSFNLKKVDAEHQTQELTGATFKLYSDVDCENQIVIVDYEGTGYDYRIATPAEAAVEANKENVITAGNVKIFGLDEGTYYVKEITPPADYNLLEAPKDFEIVKTKDDTSLEVLFLNSKGSFLPSTGGMGTTIFIVAGSVLMAGGFIGFITKKRMSLKEEEQ